MHLRAPRSELGRSRIPSRAGWLQTALFPLLGRFPEGCQRGRTVSAGQSNLRLCFYFNIVMVCRGSALITPLGHDTACSSGRDLGPTSHMRAAEPERESRRMNLFSQVGGRGRSA